MAVDKTDLLTDSEDPQTMGTNFAFPFLSSRRLPDSKGIYVEGKVNGSNVHFTADTGASTSILSFNVYSEILEEYRPKLKGNSILKGAGGFLIQVYVNGIF
jgi:hypothetical protein